MTMTLPSPTDVRTLHGINVRRLMARLDLTLDDVVAATGLDERTVRSLLRGNTRPHARTLHKLAKGLGVATDELFHDWTQAAPSAYDRAAFDRATNPLVTEVIGSQPELFHDWTQAEFDELFSRMGVGGELTEAGAAEVAEAINSRRQLLFQVSVILESGEADLMREFVELLFRRVTDVD